MNHSASIHPDWQDISSSQPDQSDPQETAAGEQTTDDGREGRHCPSSHPEIENQKSKIENPDARLIPLAQIVPNPHQPRRHFDEDALFELAESISQHGLLQPILLRQMAPQQYELIAGERRFRAAQLAGLSAIPAIVRVLTDTEEAELALIENLQREDLRPVEMARAFHTLMFRFGLTQSELSQRIGKSPSVISRITRLLMLPETILDALERGEILERHTRALLTIKNRELRERLCQQVLENNLSIQETEKLVRTALGGETDTEPPRTEPSIPRDSAPSQNHEGGCLEARSVTTLGLQLAAHLQTEVEVSLDARGTGFITIECYSPAHFLHMAQTLLNITF